MSEKKEICLMSSPLRTLLPAVMTCLFLACPLSAWAGVPPNLIKDFQPVTGHVVMPVDGAFLIDLDAMQRVTVGDLFSVLNPHREIVAQGNQKLLADQNRVKGLLRVTQVRNGYSYARALGSAKGIHRGDQIRRFEDVSATFWDYTGRGETLFNDLRRALPFLQWQGYAAAQKERPAAPGDPGKVGTELVFILTPKTLKVRDAASHLLHVYPAPTDLATAKSTPSVPPAGN
jgi:hypothetical protein